MGAVKGSLEKRVFRVCLKWGITQSKGLLGSFMSTMSLNKSISFVIHEHLQPILQRLLLLVIGSKS